MLVPSVMVPSREKKFKRRSPLRSLGADWLPRLPVVEKVQSNVQGIGQLVAEVEAMAFHDQHPGSPWCPPRIVYLSVVHIVRSLPKSGRGHVM